MTDDATDRCRTIARSEMAKLTEGSTSREELDAFLTAISFAVGRDGAYKRIGQILSEAGHFDGIYWLPNATLIARLQKGLRP